MKPAKLNESGGVDDPEPKPLLDAGSISLLLNHRYLSSIKYIYPHPRILPKQNLVTVSNSNGINTAAFLLQNNSFYQLQSLDISHKEWLEQCQCSTTVLSSLYASEKKKFFNSNSFYASLSIKDGILLLERVVIIIEEENLHLKENFDSNRIVTKNSSMGFQAKDAIWMGCEKNGIWKDSLKDSKIKQEEWISSKKRKMERAEREMRLHLALQVEYFPPKRIGLIKGEYKQVTPLFRSNALFISSPLSPLSESIALSSREVLFEPISPFRSHNVSIILPNEGFEMSTVTQPEIENVKDVLNGITSESELKSFPLESFGFEKSFEDLSPNDNLLTPSSDSLEESYFDNCDQAPVFSSWSTELEGCISPAVSTLPRQKKYFKHQIKTKKRIR